VYAWVLNIPEGRSGSVTVRQFLVQDPDGYLLRFSERIRLRA
jgi:hypothetical protein